MEKILYLECYSGISGDMTVGALLDLGASRQRLEKALESLHVDGYHLHFGRKKKCGIDAYDFDVHLEADEGQHHDEEGHHHYDGEGDHGHHHHGEDAYHGHEDEGHDHHHHDSDGHHHHHHEEACHSHDSDGHHHHHHEAGHHHPHVHRNLNDIYQIIDRMEEKEEVRQLARKMFRIVAEAEAKAHGLPIEGVHFHEVGAIDSIVDIISTAVLVDDLAVDRVIVSPLWEGRGYVRCQHGLMPVPVPATAGIVSACGLKLHLTDNEGEMVTPTGAAIAAALSSGDKLPEQYVVRKVGIGAGNKDFKNANILRAMILERAEEGTEGSGTRESGAAAMGEGPAAMEERPADSLWVLETNIDDCTGEALGFVMEELLSQGAKDVWHTPIFMKKNRSAVLLSVLCENGDREMLEETLFLHTTTIGIRRYPVERTALERREIQVDTPWGKAQAKVCIRGKRLRVAPEYESVKQICREQGLAYEQVYRTIQRLGEEMEQ